MRFRLIALILVLGGLLTQAALADIEPPTQNFRHVERSVTGASRFDLVRSGKPAFSVVVSDTTDSKLSTAAQDLAQYLKSRWGAAPKILTDTDSTEGDLIVLASLQSLAKLPAAFRAIAAQAGDLGEQAFLIQRIALPGNQTALLCLGGGSIGARYATIEILRRMTYDRQQAFLNLDRLRDEPYSTWRAIYINDSAHQANNYDPNLIYPVATNRWPLEKWKRYIDQLAFFRYNVLQIWLVPEMFTPKALEGGGVYDYVRDTLNSVARYARPRGIEICVINGINVAVDSGTLLNTLPAKAYKDMPIYRYLSPNNPAEKQLMFALWNHWSKALSDVDMWALFPGDPGGCAEESCGPETYVDLSIELSHIIRKNNPKAIIDFCPWQFFGWGPTWPSQFRKDTARIDRGYRYLLTKVDDFPPGTIFSPNLNDYTSNPPVQGAGTGGNTIEYIDEIHKKGHLIHTWTYFVTEGEGWLNHHDRVAGILRQRAIEAKYPISGGICYTMTPSLNLLSQFACAEAYWDPDVTAEQVLGRFTDGVFGTSAQTLIDIFPSFEIGPQVGYTFAKAPVWSPDFTKIHSEMEHNRAVLTSLKFSRPPRFDLLISPQAYTSELLYFADLYANLSKLGEAVAETRKLVKQTPAFRDYPDEKITMAEAEQALRDQPGGSKQELENAILAIQKFDVPAMKSRYREKHYQIFIDYPTDFTNELPMLINGFFESFGSGFVQ
jgi:hypothetical protein